MVRNMCLTILLQILIKVKYTGLMVKNVRGKSRDGNYLKIYFSNISNNITIKRIDYLCLVEDFTLCHAPSAYEYLKYYTQV